MAKKHGTVISLCISSSFLPSFLLPAIFYLLSLPPSVLCLLVRAPPATSYLVFIPCASFSHPPSSSHAHTHTALARFRSLPHRRPPPKKKKKVFAQHPPAFFPSPFYICYSPLTLCSSALYLMLPGNVLSHVTMSPHAVYLFSFISAWLGISTPWCCGQASLGVGSLYKKSCNVRKVLKRLAER